ncbi:ABC transporter permease [Mesorhizobium sp.]|uniref:ABC transporter permease n=1 Tax=Mesorhizobium sp. TaxID=1871066 RepID=UPI002600BF86|nr:ABC transporter permease [Mesorhizobium sp.]
MTIQTEPLKSVSDIERTTLMTFLSGRIASMLGGRRWRRLAPLAVLVVLCILITIANPNFIELRNLVRLANSAAVPLTLAMGLTFIILMGSIDLSVEGTLSVAAMVVVLLAANDSNGNDYGWWAVLAAVAAGTIMGLISGLVQTMLRIPSFMATLGMWFIGLGLSVYMLGGSAIRLNDASIRDLALHRFLGLPLAVWVAVGAFVLAAIIQYHTRLGRHILAIGGDEDVTKLSGVNVTRVRIAAFALAGFFFGIAGVLAAAQLGQSHAVIGDGRLFAAVTAVVVGGTALTGGEGGVVNTLIGVLIVTVLANGMILLGISPYIQQTVQGLMIIAAVALSLDRVRLKIVK